MSKWQMVVSLRMTGTHHLEERGAVYNPTKSSKNPNVVLRCLSIESPKKDFTHFLFFPFFLTFIT